MTIRLLQAGDAARLLAFELANRAWFEQHVEARDPAFYTAQGVAAHVDEYLAGHAAGAIHPCVLLDDDGAIVGRANLRHINRYAGTGEVGYRIARDHAGRGLASAALAHLQDVARDRYGLRRLQAWVSEHNAGSQRVMAKCGFTRDAWAAPVVVRVNGAPQRTCRYHCAL